MSTLSFDELKPLALTLVSQLVNADFAAVTTSFDSQMKNALSEAKLEEFWQKMTEHAGAFRQQAIAGAAELGMYRIVVVTCQFEHAVINVQVVFNVDGQVSGLAPATAPGSAAAQAYNPPAYVDQSGFHESEVTVGTGEWALPGTLSMPDGVGPFPGLVLVHGSGPNDRDETIGPNKVFRDLAWGLSSMGIAVLRYDKRTMAHKGKFNAELVAKFTVKEEVVDDALLAVRLLRHTYNIDHDRVFVLGHSLGATLIPRIGQQDPTLSGLIVMAGITRPLEDTVLDQFTYLCSLAGPLTEQQKAGLEILKAQVAKAKDPELSGKTPSSELPLGMSPAYLLSLRGYHPEEVAKTLPMPILILQGERDYQVLPTVDFGSWQAALKDKANVTLKLYPKLNHLFIAGEGTPNPQEYNTEGHVSENAVKDIAAWIKKIRPL